MVIQHHVKRVSAQLVQRVREYTQASVEKMGLCKQCCWLSYAKCVSSDPGSSCEQSVSLREYLPTFPVLLDGTR